MIYTKSVDGVQRMTMKIDARLTQEEYRAYNLLAKQLGYKNLREFMTIYMTYWWDNLDGKISEFEEMR